MLTVSDYWMGRDAAYPDLLSNDLRAAATETVARANLLLSAYRSLTKDEEPRRVNSGWRPPSVNAATPNAAPRSKHMSGHAIDISDPEGDLDEWCMDNPEILQTIGLWQEHPSATKGWCHVQTIPPKSGKRVFYP
jgi:LAS superfamily LD-carboxypeptidase LdcB